MALPTFPVPTSPPSSAPAAIHPPASATSSEAFQVQGTNKTFAWAPTWRQLVFGAILLFCLTPWASPPVALALGLGLAQTVGNPFSVRIKALTPKLLQFSVVGLGFGMNAHAAVQVGQQGLLLTVGSIGGTLLLGYVVGRWLGLSRHVTHLISCGTAICGGSAIAAVGPVLRAKDEAMSVSLATVFVLNVLALFAFPSLGHTLQLTQQQFGLWCAIAIHDTSSVVGAASAYGSEALQVATTVKLARALWIIPVSVGTALVFKQKGVKIKLPYFILGFIGAMLINTFVPAAKPLGPVLVGLAKMGLTVTLFFIGAGLSGRVLRAVGSRPYVLGLLLWLAVSVGSLYVILRAG